MQSREPARLAHNVSLPRKFRPPILLASLCVVPALCCFTRARPAAEESGKKFYLQLVRGNDEEAPPAPGAVEAGPRVTERLQAVLRWKHYWEMQRDAVVVPCGQKVRKRLSTEREVEIERPPAPSENIAVRVYLDGKLSQSRLQPARDAFFITGGAKGRDQSWFIVVREDQPPDLATD